MATTTQTTTETASDLKLTPPEPVPVVTAEKAAGLVPVSEEKKSKLDEKVEAFVADLVASDANSPEFGKKVDQLTNMGRKEIMAAAQMSTGPMLRWALRRTAPFFKPRTPAARGKKR